MGWDWDPVERVPAQLQLLRCSIGMGWTPVVSAMRPIVATADQPVARRLAGADAARSLPRAGSKTHSAVDDPTSPAYARSRENIEVRTLALCWSAVALSCAELAEHFEAPVS